MSKRLLALDAFRGFTIMGMVLVNTPGSWSYVYPPLRHANWNGCTPTDLVFPFFLFIVGVSMSFSFSKYNYSWSPALGRKILKRTVIIFVLGLLLNAFPFYDHNLADLRIMGVLQRIALSYGIAAVLVAFLKDKHLYFFIPALALLYWGLLWWGGGADPYSLGDNLVRKLDLSILGESHLYNNYELDGEKIRFDPEGLLSTLGGICSVLIGYLVGRQIKTKGIGMLTLRNLLIAGVILIGIGLLWNLFLPINKPIWTSSYVFYTAGLGTLFLVFFIWIIDILDKKNWVGLMVMYGVNPLILYVLSGLVAKVMFRIKWTDAAGESVNLYGWLYNQIFVPIFGNLNGSLAFAIFQVCLIGLVGWILYRRKIFIKV